MSGGSVTCKDCGKVDTWDGELFPRSYGVPRTQCKVCYETARVRWKGGRGDRSPQTVPSATVAQESRGLSVIASGDSGDDLPRVESRRVEIETLAAELRSIRELLERRNDSASPGDIQIGIDELKREVLACHRAVVDMEGRLTVMYRNLSKEISDTWGGLAGLLSSLGIRVGQR